MDVVNSESGDILIPANRKITKTLLRKLAANYNHVEIDPSPIRIKIMGIIDEYRGKFNEAKEDKNRSLDRAGSGEEVDAGIVKSVKVYIATKKKLSWVIRWLDVTETKGLFRVSWQKRICPSCRMERRWISS